jgi:murein DD-endopeptidase MepM/ murein hydrolase activator NlpD
VDHGTGLGTAEVSVDGGAGAALAVDGDAARVALDTTRHPDGAHVVAVVARDRSWWRNGASLEASVRFDNTPPALTVSPASTLQGGVASIGVVASEPLVNPVVVVGPHAWGLRRVGPDRWRALLGVGAAAAPGPVPIVVAASDAAGNSAAVETTYVVEPRSFPPGTVADDTLAPRAETATERSRRAAVDVDMPVATWDPVWILPAEGRRGAGYGVAVGSSFHTGLDVLAAPGEPVRAASSGLVVHVDEEPVRGRHVVVDHGHGVATGYDHLDKVDVGVGEEVRGGDLLGTVGSTGASRLPHVHFEVLVAGEPVDPIGWLAAPPPPGE